MNNVPDKVLCTKTHEYILPEGNTAKIGITDYAVEQLGDIVFVELPEENTSFSKGEVFGTIESVKAASELYMPIDGKVIEINEKLAAEPELINDDPFGAGWLIKITDYNSENLSNAMTYDEYKEFLEEEEEEE
ncbi:MAG: glycine cleavage system protein H [Candidatus Melainabacteria bacterium RIFOXYA12_FULL_32_12]|nr:MAG: glycine cleavage system protein H [Candidatus Melainabacteria bacterium GWF2_32_7]OGI16677.1 MAG: glycine cleavage system protein H [Candidatus Melainabacteria bacterium RIFOXYA2_FULL_32_9]OGI31640.1 MAG: glycine cleavage system protein H [Candidatus Melainabacteria bacterium RIFOXYA12_FULL_32_12]